MLPRSSLAVSRLRRWHTTMMSMQTTDWLLTARERGNPATRLDRRHRDGAAWTSGNDVVPLVHGGAYFPELTACVEGMRAGDLLLFTDWRGDPDQSVEDTGG